MKYDVCVIGGGAAGLAAAASFNKDMKVCLLEKNSAPGRKIAATGGGRCNITNADCENSGQVLEFFRSLGLETFSDNEGRYYPRSERAADVVEILQSAIGVNVTVMCGVDVSSVTAVSRGFAVTGNDMSGKGKAVEIKAGSVLIAMGGKAGPQYGTTGDGYRIAKSMGHSITRVFPILSGIECSAENVDFRQLKGIRAAGVLTLHERCRDKHAAGSCPCEQDIVRAREEGEIQFTDYGISGICAFNLTPCITAEDGEKPADAMKRYSIHVDLAPGLEEDKVKRRSTGFGIVTRKLADAVPPEKLKDWELQVKGVKGWKNAQATAGGVELGEINMDTMESRIVQGLYFAGEIINVQGPCGGFNLQNAWETGIRAAKAINGSFGSGNKKNSPEE